MTGSIFGKEAMRHGFNYRRGSYDLKALIYRSVSPRGLRAWEIFDGLLYYLYLDYNSGLIQSACLIYNALY